MICNQISLLEHNQSYSPLILLGIPYETICGFKYIYGAQNKVENVKTTKFWLDWLEVYKYAYFV